VNRLHQQHAAATTVSPWPHRFAVALVCVTFPLIWVGGLVTTYQAGMSVPDWPGTFGWNMFAYPWETWVYGPWDIFIEHGHRLLGAVAGLVTIALVVAAFRCDRRPWFRRLSLVALALVIAQGVLGGVRVVDENLLLARLHGCVGPAFFALAVALAVFTSNYWRAAPRIGGAAASRRLAAGAGLFVVVAYAQLVLGAHLRHMPPGMSHRAFRVVLVFHIGAAIALWLGAAYLTWSAWRRKSAGLRTLATFLSIILLAQLALGAATWIAKYNWPAWALELGWGTGRVVIAESYMQAATITAHVAGGSLVLAVGAMLALRAMRLTWTHAPERRESAEWSLAKAAS